MGLFAHMFGVSSIIFSSQRVGDVTVLLYHISNTTTYIIMSFIFMFIYIYNQEQVTTSIIARSIDQPDRLVISTRSSARSTRSYNISFTIKSFFSPKKMNKILQIY